MAGDDEVRAAVDAINMAIEGLPEDVHVMVHICQGNYAVGPDYDGQIGHRYFDHGRYKADLVCQIECDGYLIEHDMTPHYESCLGDKQLGVGAVDVQAPNVETGEQVAERIRAHRWLAPEQTIITSSCGFNHLPRHIALGKLRAMTEAKAILTGRRPYRSCMNDEQDNRYRRIAVQPALWTSSFAEAEAASGIGAFELRFRIQAMGMEPASRGAVRAISTEMRPQLSRNGCARVFADDVPKIRAALEAAQESGDFYVEFRVRTADGTLHWLAGKGQIAAQDGGCPDAARDLLRHQRAQAARSAAPRRQRDVGGQGRGAARGSARAGSAEPDRRCHWRRA